MTALKVEFFGPNIIKLDSIISVGGAQDQVLIVVGMKGSEPV